ncbi:MAG: PQQ-binding-like beta-propeller repeat protein, partial [Candidatus Aminicenantes bacterium]|nr:PQQ-binding-like beta-propeller repeat protein [Candidatus Aminicenantes bacterium]
MKKHAVYLTLLLFFFASVGMLQATDNWPHWRGPSHNGIVDSKTVPTTWSLSDNIKWKTPLPAWSAATPIIWGDHVFVTSPSKAEPKAKASEDKPAEKQQTQRRRRASIDPGGPELFLYCLSKKDGSILWKKLLDNKNEIHRKQNDATPSPVTDGKHVWIVTGTGVVAAFDMDGKQVWKMNLQQDYGTFGLNWGYASSPLLYQGSLIIEVLHGMKTDDPSYIISLDALTGKVNWRQERPTDAQRESPDAYTTPVVLEFGGQTQIVISGADYVTGHDPKTGKEIWRAAGLNPLHRPNYRIVG